MRVSLITFCTLLAIAAAPATVPAAQVTLPHCLVSLIEEVQVPAEEAGVLSGLAVKEGQQVKTEELLAKIDDVQAKMQVRVAGLKLAVAGEKAANDVSIRYSTAAAAVAAAEYQLNVEANQKVPGTVPKTEIRKLLLTWQRAALEIEQAEMTMRIDGLQAKVSEAEVEASQEILDRHSIKSPLDGVVVELYHHAGEWVKPGDPVMHVVRVDRLRVEGFLNASEVAPGEVDGQPVGVRVELARGRVEQFAGRIVFVSPLVQAGGEYQVWAEVENRQEGEHWLLRPGLNAQMTIQSR